jgi:hypothetical protein
MVMAQGELSIVRSSCRLSPARSAAGRPEPGFSDVLMS